MENADGLLESHTFLCLMTKLHRQQKGIIDSHDTWLTVACMLQGAIT